MKASFHLLISSLLSLSLATAGSGAQAELLRSDSGASAERERINAALQRPEIRARLVAEGVDLSATEARVAALTDEEVALLGTSFDELPAAGRDPRGLAALVLVAAAVYVVVQFWPFFLIGGGALVAIKASNRSPG